MNHEGISGNKNRSRSQSISNNEISQVGLLTIRRKPSIVSKVSQTLREVGKTLKDRKEFAYDFDKYEDEKPLEVKYIPERLEILCRETGMDKSQMRSLYRAFKKECPSGAITEVKFRNIYCQLFPAGVDGNAYAHYIFKALDTEETGCLTFGEIIRGLSAVVNGSLQERINWIFRLYDIDHDGEIRREELSAVIGAVHDLIGPSDLHSEIHTDLAFRKFDLNADGVITIDEFTSYCSNDEIMRKSFAMFDGFWQS